MFADRVYWNAIPFIKVPLCQVKQWISFSQLALVIDIMKEGFQIKKILLLQPVAFVLCLASFCKKL